MTRLVVCPAIALVLGVIAVLAWWAVNTGRSLGAW